MPKYRLHSNGYLRPADKPDHPRFFKAGEIIESDEIPGRDWEPLDEEGWRRFHARHAGSVSRRFRFPVQPPEVTR